MKNIEQSHGSGNSLGASYDGYGTNFAIYSSTAVHVVLNLFFTENHEERGCYPLIKGENNIWHCYLSNVEPGDLYHYFIDGPFEPKQGLWHKPRLPLIDPYARQFNGQFSWINKQGTSYKSLNLQPEIPKNEVVNIGLYEGKNPKIPWNETVIYECNVKGATQEFPDIADSLKGKFLGLAQPSFIKHLKKLGVTTVQLLPVHYFIDEEFLLDKGLSNYWGYNSLSFFVPHHDYLVNGQIQEFQDMVKAFHQADLEVIIDVVYNHTAEGNNLGPTLSWRGIDNKSYYRLHRENYAEYINDTGCGNTINASSKMTIKLIVDSLRYWVEYMGVDGFRFDLASILGRNYRGFRDNHAFFQVLNQDPLLSKVKLIAEPWDIGPGGYQLGAFPAPWREWNDQYRDVIRRFWRGEAHMLPRLAKHIHGSGYLFEHQSRPVTSGINFITAHDGFTLADLVSFQYKQNGSNQEDNLDGHNENFSYNWGCEGATDDKEINSLRVKLQKNMLLTLAFSLGVPMLSMGCEVGNSQQGNNNAYCQNNSQGWVNWPDEPSEHPLTEFIGAIFNLRRQFDLFKHTEFIHDDDHRFNVNWLNEYGKEMSEDDWQYPTHLTLGYYLSDNIKKQSLLILLNASAMDIEFPVPTLAFNTKWYKRLDTRISPEPLPTNEVFHSIDLEAYSAIVLSSNLRIDNEENHG